MKATFEFQLPDEREEYDMYRKAGSYMHALEAFSSYLRSVIKYNTGMENLPEAEMLAALALYETVREKWHEILQENGVSE